MTLFSVGVIQLDLLGPSRRFVREKILCVLESKKKRERKVYLFNDCILFTKPASKKEHLKGHYSLSDIRIVDVADTEGTHSSLSLSLSHAYAAKRSIS